MLSRLLIVVFLCLCAGTASGAVKELTMGAIVAGFTDWDSTGGAATKTIALTDDDNTTYILSTAAGDADRYEVEDAADDMEEIDSIQIVSRGREASTGNNKIQYAIVVNTGSTNGQLANLTTTWTTYTDMYTAHPEGGNWTLGGLDSLRLVFVANKHASACHLDSVRINVYYKSLNRTLMFPEKDDACLSGANFDHDLRRKSAMQNDTAFVFALNGAGTTSDNWKTGDAVTAYHKMNNDDWETGGFGIFLDVVHVKADCSLTVRVQRWNSSCALQESTPFFPATGAQLLIDTTGHYEFQIPQYDWSSGACGDELAVEFLWSNAVGQADDSVWIRYGVADTYFEHEIVINQSPCPAGEGAGDCAGQPSTDTTLTLPDQEGGISQFVNVGGAANLIAAIKDAFPADSANYMMEDVIGQQQEVQFAGISAPADLGSYDSITVQVRARRNVSLGGRVRFRTQLQDSTNVGNECNDTYTALKSVAFVTFEPLTIFGLPSGTDACEGAITTAGINTLEAKFSIQSLASGKELHITNVDLIICYTIAAAGGGQVMRIQLGIKDDPLDWAEKKWWAGREHPLYPDRGTVWSVKNSKRWLWEK